MDEKQSQFICEQRLNSLTGEAEWIVITETLSLHDDEPSKRDSQSLAHTQYLDMLNDGPRNRAYDLAIRSVVRPGDHVLDIGAGTGLLSMMAWRALTPSVTEPLHPPTGDGDMIAGPGRVTACESYLPMVRLARRTLRANGMSSGIRLIHKRSDEMEVGIDLPSPADVLVCEVLDSELLGEGMIPTLRHAIPHLLKPSARTVPHRATVYGQLVECDFLWRCQDLAGVENGCGDGLVLGIGAVCGLSSAMHVDALAGQLSLLSEPFEVFRFEFSEMPADRGECEVDVVITAAGNVHALVSWWDLQLDEEGTVVYSTAPDWVRTLTGGGSIWRDHWKQCVWFFPGMAVKSLPGDTVRVRASHDEVSVRYGIEYQGRLVRQQVEEENNGSSFPQANSGFHSILAVRPERIGCVGDGDYRRVIREALKKAVATRSSPVCLVADDSVLCTLTAALVDSDSQVVTMLPGLQKHGSSFIKSLAKANAVSDDRIQFVGKKASQLSVHDLKGRKVDILIAEPYYRAHEDLLPWRNLRFWYECTQLAPLLAEHPTIIPCTGILRGVAVFLPDLWHSRTALTNVEGFDHSHLNDVLGACGELSSHLEGPLLPYRVWQCGQCKELTESFSIMTFDFSLPLQEVEGSVNVPVTSPGLCHGIVLWMDWVMDPQHELVLSTGPFQGKPDYWKQGVKLLSSPVKLCLSTQIDTNRKECGEINVSAVFSPTTGDIEVYLCTAPSAE